MPVSRSHLAALAVSILPLVGAAQAAQSLSVPSILYGHEARDAQGRGAPVPVGLLAVNAPTTAPHSGCEQFAHWARITQVQYSASGVSVEVFGFEDGSGHRAAMPSGIGGYSNAERAAVNDFLRPGREVYLRYERCGSGGFPALIEVVDWKQLAAPRVRK